ncbi:gliding motility-associated ABC transporter substrate-binding protein GldG [Sediminitomix flava]|uniref:Gliding-associated putative ABC transporter substrate-binding component GldG n=1 Tax=Sediminitomix flava TaxID=379075 RepID=A0A315ZBM5_SEDFL|nr:gliding motility-associated ABC transporter substrate-binding protein GldG [Sediminitomix flava]PWJ42975.1 gliding-associated putative ABC transporter substrate-binding component GldG [Sediminitomix flava]
MNKVLRFKKWEDILTFLAIVLSVIWLNQIANKFYFKWDLTEEKRFTISDGSKNVLRELQGDIFIEVFLDGELNAEFKRLQEHIRETLISFRDESKGKLNFKFINPNASTNPKVRNQTYQKLTDKGLPPTTLFDVADDGERIQKVIFPGVIIHYGKKEKGILLLKGNKTASAEQQLNQSIEGVEFELINTIHELSAKSKKRVAFIQGHQELTPQQTIDLTTTLNQSYVVDHVRLDGKQNIEGFDAIIVAQPKTAFSEMDKFILDKYIMNGGNAMFLMDMVQMNLDSIPLGGTYAFGRDLNIDELLFRYGIRLNYDLIQDQQAGLIEIVTGNFGDKANVQTLPWPYYNYMSQFSDHPIVRNMDVVYGKFVSTLDTAIVDNVKKTPLIFSSKYSRIKKIPGLVSLDEIKEAVKKELFNQPYLPTAYLLEGEFKSLFANRFPPKGADKNGMRKTSLPAKIIVVGDGDIIKNEINPQTGKMEPIDFDKYRKSPLSNKEFILNSLSYLTDDSGIINARKKSITIRPLDKFKVGEEKLQWQVINILVPVLIISLFGILWFWLRKRRYESFKK